MPTNSCVLVVGGAGYIGSHMTLALREAGYTPIVLDNLSTGHRDAVLGAELIIGEMSDKKILADIFNKYKISAVMHFASFIEVGESVKNPLKYYQNNLSATLVLLEVMLENNIKQFIFSSTAAVYGEPQYTPIDEAHPIAPINPYGHSKAMVEQVLHDLSLSHDLQFAVLRYFNAAGADPKGRLSERHEPESHLIPLVLQAITGKRDFIKVNGRNYPTPDGTCVRDYVHVTDLCKAHLLALKQLAQGEKKIIANLGTGHGFSVQQVIEAAKRVTQKDITVQEGPPRAGDPAFLVANAALAKEILNWQPEFGDLELIIKHAYHSIS